MADGTKYDAGKPRTDLIPPTAIWAMAQVFAYGADKYDDRNWEQGLEYHRTFGAIQRHLWAFWQGEDADPESGLPHLAHALCGMAMLYDTTCRRPDLDDRPDYTEMHGHL